MVSLTLLSIGNLILLLGILGCFSATFGRLSEKTSDEISAPTLSPARAPTALSVTRYLKPIAAGLAKRVTPTRPSQPTAPTPPATFFDQRVKYNVYQTFIGISAAAYSVNAALHNQVILLVASDITDLPVDNFRVINYTDTSTLPKKLKVSYAVRIPSSAEAGYQNGSMAYKATKKALQYSVYNTNNFNLKMYQTAALYSDSALLAVYTDSISFSSPDYSDNSSLLLALAIIAIVGIVIAILCGCVAGFFVLAFLCCRSILCCFAPAPKVAAGLGPGNPYQPVPTTAMVQQPGIQMQPYGQNAHAPMMPGQQQNYAPVTYAPGQQIPGQVQIYYAGQPAANQTAHMQSQNGVVYATATVMPNPGGQPQAPIQGTVVATSIKSNQL